MNSKKRRRKHVSNDNTMNIQNNGISRNSLIHLVEQYNSDSDEDESENDNKQGLDEKVNDFFKEIQYITQNKDSTTSLETIPDSTKSSELSSNCDRVPFLLWQECYDESTGYPYYWHTETNEVTWDIPIELKESRDKLSFSSKYQSKSEDSVKVKGSSASRSSKSIDSSIKNSTNETSTENTSRSKHKRKNDSGHVKNKSSLKESKTKKKSDDSDDGHIEMITSFGDENSDSDQSDDEKIDEQSSKTTSRKIDSCETQELPKNNIYSQRIDDSKNEYQMKGDKSQNSHQRVSNNCSKNIKSQEESMVEFKNGGKPWCIVGYTDNSDSDDNLNNKKTTSTLFPTAFNKSRACSSDRDVKGDKNNEQSEHSAGLDVEFSNNDESTQMFSKGNELPKMNRTLETLGTSIKGFQRKRRIAFDVLTNTRGNDERLGFGFLKKSSTDLDTVNKDPSSSGSYEEKKRNLGKYSIDFVKGETIEVKNEIAKTENYIFTHQVQMIVEKLKILCEKSSSIPPAPMINIQLQTLLQAWESGDLNDSYFFNWLNDTKKRISEIEEAAAPSEWHYLWDKDSKKYYYKNKTSDEIQWNYPDVIGGAEEMELCTTPPISSSPVHQPEIKTLDSDVFERLQNNLEQSENTKLLAEKSNSNNSNQNQKQEDDNCSKQSDKIRTDMENKEGENITAPMPPQISIPSPPPPPRIYAEDLKKKNNKLGNNEGQTNISAVSVSKDNTINAMDEIEKKNSMNAVEGTSTAICESLLSSTNSHLAVTNSTPHIEPLPPGVDQSEGPYAITAASIESPVIFSTNPQPNASIYAAAISNPTNISIIGHHPALVHNQIVHYPTVYQHLHDQAIIAAANRFTGQEAVQLMLHHPGIYANTQVISKPPVNMKKESLGSAVDSFYNDIASLENQANTNDKQEVKNSQPTTLQPTTHRESSPALVKSDTQASSSSPTTDNNCKEKKKKKVKIVINKKHKEVSSMVAKWKKVQNFEDIN